MEEAKRRTFICGDKTLSCDTGTLQSIPIKRHIINRRQWEAAFSKDNWEVLPLKKNPICFTGKDHQWQNIDILMLKSGSKNQEGFYRVRISSIIDYVDPAWRHNLVSFVA